MLIDSILSAHDRRAALVNSYQTAISVYKTSKDVKTFKSSKKSLDDRYKASSEEVAALVKDVQGLDGDANAKVPIIISKYSVSCNPSQYNMSWEMPLLIKFRSLTAVFCPPRYQQAWRMPLVIKFRSLTAVFCLP